MHRGIGTCAIVAVCALLAPRSARADELDPAIDELAHGDSYKERLAAAINLSKSHDARAVVALATALVRDDEVTIRRVCALALAKIVDEETPAKARSIALDALTHAKDDKAAKVRTAAQKALVALAALATAPAGGGPAVFVNVGGATDLTKKAPRDAEGKLAGIVKNVVKRGSYAVEWPGGLPTEKDLTRAGSHGFYVAATIALLTVTKRGTRAEIACTVSIRIAPWSGTDGAEKWEASKAASASGSGKVITGSTDNAVADGMRDCVLAVGEEVAQRQVVPFIKRLANP
jgi:hypothetical protein